MSEEQPLAGFRIGVTAAREVGEQIALLERRGARCEWAPAPVAAAQAGGRRRAAARVGAVASAAFDMGDVPTVLPDASRLASLPSRREGLS